MFVRAEVRLDKENVEFIKKTHKELRYRSLSEYIGDALIAKIKVDRKKVRAIRRTAAMAMLGVTPSDNLFEPGKGDELEDR